MKDASIAKVGSICAIAAGLLYFVLGIIFYLLPPAHRPGSGLPEGEFLSTGNQGFGMLILEMWVIALSALCVIGVIMAVSELVRSGNEGLVRYTATLATIGCAVIAMTYLLDQWHTPQLLLGYPQLDRSGQAVLDVIGTRHFDPQGFFGFGLVGLWVLVVNLLALRHGFFPRRLAYAGLVVTLAYWLVVAGRVLPSPPLVAAAAFLGGIVGPWWYIGIGMHLRSLVSPQRVVVAPQGIAAK